MKWIIISHLFLLIGMVNLMAQKATIPFRINESNRIILKYPIKNRILNLCFDSGIPFNILDVDIAEKLDFAKPNNYKVDSISSVGNVSIGIINYAGKQKYKQDSVFWGSWMNSNMKKTAQKLELGTNVDGIVGYCSDYTLELNFQQNTMTVWDTFPENCMKGTNIRKVKLVDSDYGGTYLYRIGINPLCIRSELTVLDTLRLQTNLLIDTGNPMYLTMEVFDSSLLNKLIEFKKVKGDLYHTTRLRIPELETDTSFCKLKVLQQLDKNIMNPFRAPIGGLLGVSFLRQFHRVIFNRNQQVAWFEK